MPERTLLRIGSVSAIAGAVFLIVFNVLHPPSGAFDDTRAHLQGIADSGIYQAVHVGILVGALLLLGGQGRALYRSIAAEPGAALARLGFAAALVGTATISLDIATDGIALKVVADAWASSQDPALFQAAYVLEQVVAGIFSIWIFVLLGVSFSLYGLAVALSDVYPKWLGWAALVVAIGAGLIGLAEAFSGHSVVLTNILFPIASILLTVWMLVMGALMWRRAGAAA